MTQSAEIQCINKNPRNDPYRRITHVGGYMNGQRWKITVAEAIQHIRNQTWKFYTNSLGHRVDVVIARSAYGNEYLRTKADYDTPDNLLSLPECP